MSEQGRYVYAVTRGLDPSSLAGTTGLDGRPLDLVRHRDLTAVVSDVDLEEYGEDGLRANLEDLPWLERVARGHDAVVQAAAAAAPTAPMRLAMICLDDAGVVERLAEWHDALVDVLDRVESRVEWSVKVYTARRPATPVGAPGDAPGAGGAAYLQRKKAEAQARRTEETTSMLMAEEVHEQLLRVAVASRRLAPQDPRLTGRTDQMLHNGAYLVDAARSAEFAALVDQVESASPDVVVECHGPWPPYSFASLEQQS